MNLYNVYDMRGNKLISNKDSKTIGRTLDITPQRVAKCANYGQSVRGIYKIEKVDCDFEKEKNSEFENLLLDEWDKVTAPFRNIIWVKEYKEGVKRLGERR